jgi:hypothetical protein
MAPTPKELRLAMRQLQQSLKVEELADEYRQLTDAEKKFEIRSLKRKLNHARYLARLPYYRQYYKKASN